MDSRLLDRVKADIDVLNTPRQWVEPEFDSQGRRIRLHVGIIHSNGDRERAFKTIHYELDRYGQVYTTEQVHT